MPGRLGGGETETRSLYRKGLATFCSISTAAKTPSAEGHASQWEFLMGEIGSGADRPWTIETVQELISLARERMPAAIMSLRLKRSEITVRAKLAELGWSPLPRR
jgi:hypothetical protein